MLVLGAIACLSAGAGACSAPAAPETTSVEADVADVAAAKRPAFDITLQEAQQRIAAAGGPEVTAWKLGRVSPQGRACLAAEEWTICTAPDGRVQDIKLQVAGNGSDKGKALAPSYLRTLAAAIAPNAPAGDWTRLDQNLVDALAREKSFVFVDDGARLRPVEVRTAGHSWSLLAAVDIGPAR